MKTRELVERLITVENELHRLTHPPVFKVNEKVVLYNYEYDKDKYFMEENPIVYEIIKIEWGGTSWVYMLRDSIGRETFTYNDLKLQRVEDYKRELKVKRLFDE